jgi:tRNA-specific 2-thiouridylase
LDAGIGHQPVDVDVKIRYATPPAAATLLRSTNGSLQIRFHQPQRALSPGQSAVFYRGDHVLGGGIIQRS